MSEVTYRGVVSEFDDRAGYGYITPEPGANLGEDLILVHRRSLRSRSVVLEAGDTVRYRIDTVPRGLLAIDVHLDPTSDEDEQTTEESFEDEDAPQSTGVLNRAQEILSRAILARENKQFDQAATLYEKGLKECPIARMYFHYAAMEKNLGHKGKAMNILLDGIRRFPTHPNLREVAGVLAASMGRSSEAIKLLEEALPLSKKARHGTKGILLNLARTYYRVDTLPALKSAVEYYSQARRYGRRQISADDILQLSLAEIRTQHHRGNLAVKFLEAAGFRISRARLLDQQTEGADFIVQQVKHPDLIESYSLAGNLIVRCYFKAVVTSGDLHALDKTIGEWGRSDLVDDQAALIILGALPDELQRILSGRIEQKSQPAAAIIPITQSDIETERSAIDGLRNILDRWLYRRDLFAGNRPVVGRRFFGREKSLSELRDCLASSVSAGVFGLRKVGKTSLLQESQRRSVEMGDIVIYIDLLRLPSDVKDCRWLYWKIGETLHRDIKSSLGKLSTIDSFRWRLGGNFEDYLAIPSDFPVSTAFDSDLTRLLSALRSLHITPRPKVAILLDEVERLLPTSLGKSDFLGFFDFFSYLRGVSQENDNFIIIVTGANAAILEAPQFEQKDNPVFNFFKEIYLPHLEAAECSRMIRVLGRGMGLRFSEGALRKIFELTGGHPFFARRLSSFVAEKYPDRPLHVDETMIQKLLESYLDQRSSDFAEIIERLGRDYPDELRICEAIARAGGSMPIDKVRLMVGPTASIRHLTGYQIVRTDAQTAWLSMQLLTMWLRKRLL